MAGGQPGPDPRYSEADAPRLTDWKIEMNPQQEYPDPIITHYSYAGGAEGASEVRWFQEAKDSGDGPPPPFVLSGHVASLPPY